MQVSVEYTVADHRLRANDRYAQAKYEITRQWLKAEAGSGLTLINMGCGGGYFNGIAQAMGFNVIACEPDARAFEIAVAEKPERGVALHNCGLVEAARSGIRGDIVIFHDVLEHIEDEHFALSLLRQLLAPQGRCIISVPALQWLFGRHDEELGHYRRYSRRQLASAVSIDFTIEKMRYFGAFSIPIVLTFSKFLRTGYPPAASSETALGKAYGLICDAETRVTFPIGTSLIADLRAK